MSDSKIMLPQEIYVRYLEIINGIKFTSKEVEVISCIFNTRGASKIASLLAISSKTVGAHIANIKNKIGCNTQEDIIDFVEKSEDHSLINHHYQNIKIRHCFEQHLKKIRIPVSTSRLTCEITSWLDEGNQSTFPITLTKLLREQLEKHLESIKVKTTLINKKVNQFIFADKDSNNDIYRIHILPETWREQFKDQEKLLIYRLTHADDPDNHILLLLLERNPSAELFSEDFSKQNYYFAAFKLLKILFPDVELDKIISEFEKQCKLINNSVDSTTLPPWSKMKNLTQQKDSFQNLWRNPLKNKLTMASILCLSIFAIFFFISLNNKVHTISPNQTALKKQTIRSDLPLPAEGALLKRPELIKQIEEKLNEKGDIQTVSLVGIVGMGGVGKTTIARYFGRTQNSDIVWEINAESKDSLINSFKDLAYALAQTKEQKEEIDFIQKIQNPEEKEKQILSFVKRSLKENENWLLIYDNVEMFAEIKDCLPQDSQVWGTGKVIITTRDDNSKFPRRKQRGICSLSLSELE